MSRVFFPVPPDARSRDENEQTRRMSGRRATESVFAGRCIARTRENRLDPCRASHPVDPNSLELCRAIAGVDADGLGHPAASARVAPTRLGRGDALRGGDPNGFVRLPAMT